MSEGLSVAQQNFRLPDELDIPLEPLDVDNLALGILCAFKFGRGSFVI
jgi:hypothetical protein